MCCKPYSPVKLVSVMTRLIRWCDFHLTYCCYSRIITTVTNADVSLSFLGAPRHAMKMADIVSTAVREAEIYNNHKIVRLPSAN